MQVRETNQGVTPKTRSIGKSVSRSTLDDVSENRAVLGSGLRVLMERYASGVLAGWTPFQPSCALDQWAVGNGDWFRTRINVMHLHICVMGGMLNYCEQMHPLHLLVGGSLKHYRQLFLVFLPVSPFH